MAKNQKHYKSINSLMWKIEEHFIKIENSIKLNDIWQYDYYLKEINNFFKDLDNKFDQINPNQEKTKELYDQKVLLRKKFQKYESISLN